MSTMTVEEVGKLVDDAIHRWKSVLRNPYHPMTQTPAAQELIEWYAKIMTVSIVRHTEIGFAPHGPGLSVEIGDMMDFDKPYASYVAPLAEFADYENPREGAYRWAVCHCVARIEQQVQEKERGSKG